MCPKPPREEEASEQRRRWSTRSGASGDTPREERRASYIKKEEFRATAPSPPRPGRTRSTSTSPRHARPWRTPCPPGSVRDARLAEHLRALVAAHDALVPVRAAAALLEVPVAPDVERRRAVKRVTPLADGDVLQLWVRLQRRRAVPLAVPVSARVAVRRQTTLLLRLRRRRRRGAGRTALAANFFAAPGGRRRRLRARALLLLRVRLGRALLHLLCGHLLCGRCRGAVLRIVIAKCRPDIHRRRLVRAIAVQRQRLRER